MSVYIETSEEIKNVIKPYIKKGESFKSSNNIELNGKTYREIVFYKKGFAIFKGEPQAYIYLDSNNKLVSIENMQKELARLAYYHELFYSNEKNIGILAALQSDDDFQRDKANFKEAIEGLDYLNSLGVPNVLRIKQVIYKLTDLKEKSNYEINKLSQLVDDAKEQGLPFNEEILERIYPTYEEVLRLNFERVRLIGTIEDCCDEVKDAADKNKKKLKIKFNQKIVLPLMKASDQISYFRRVIRTYRSVINMNTSQYMKFLNDKNKEKIEQRVNLIRK